MLIGQKLILRSVFILAIPLLSFQAFASSSKTKHDKKPLKKTSAKATNAETTNAETTNAETTKVKSHWTGSNAQLGLVINTGNTSSTNLSGGMLLKYVNAPWMNMVQLNAQLNRSNGQTTKESYYAADQLQYAFSKARKNYVYSNVNFTDDRFSPYVYQAIGSVGYGRDLYCSDKFTWSAQAGPGFRYDNIKNTDKNDKSFIIFLASNVDWKITKSMDLGEQVQYTIGKPYDYLKTVTALTNKITGNLAMQVSYTLQYYSKIPLGSANTKNTDTITNIALVYSF